MKKEEFFAMLDKKFGEIKNFVENHSKKQQ